MAVYNSFLLLRTFTFKQTYVTNSWRSFTKQWILISTHKHDITSIKYPSHKCLPEKSYLHCLRILIMSWLFRDPVVIIKEIICLRPDCLRIQLTVAWLNLTMPNQTVRNSLKAKKTKLPQMNFFLKKQLIIFSCTY